MKPAKNSFLSRYGRYVTLGVTVAAFAGLVTFLHWRHEQHNARVSPALGVVRKAPILGNTDELSRTARGTAVF
jgi:hypothetical protein